MLLRRLQYWLNRHGRRATLHEEMRLHLEEREADLRQQGLHPSEARRRAQQEFGSFNAASEESRAVWIWPWLETIGQDIRYGLRQLRQGSTFTLVAILTLTVGIGGSACAFAVVNAVFIQGLPVPEPEQIRVLRWSSPDQPSTDRIPYPAYVEVSENSGAFEGLTCEDGARGTIGEWGQAEILVVAGNYFDVLGVAAMLGRTLSDGDDVAGSDSQVGVITYRLWQSSFAGSPDVLDRTIRIRGVPFRIVGVLEPGFSGLNPVGPRDFMIPMAAYSLATGRSLSDCRTIGRLQTGANEEAARTETELLLQAAFLRVEHTEDPSLVELQFADTGQFAAGLRDRSRLSLALLSASIGLLLLIACGNVAGLLAARGQARRREMAFRLALGASRGRLVRQLLTENLILWVASGVVAVCAALAARPFLPGLLTQLSDTMTMSGTVIPVAVPVAIDWNVVAFSLLLALMTGACFSLFPALGSSRAGLPAMTKAGYGRATAVSRPARWLVSAQVALATALLMGAGLFVRTVSNLTSVEPGYEPADLVFFMIPRDDRPTFVPDAVRRLEAIPGVISAGASVWPLFNNAEPKMPVCLPDGERNPVDIEWITPGFFDAWGIEILAGRDLLPGDGPVAIVNQTLAASLMANDTTYPVGQTIGRTLPPGRSLYSRSFDDCPALPVSIVGVVEDHRDRQREALTPMIYVPYPSNVVLDPTTFAMRTAGTSPAVIARVRQTLADLGATVDGDVTQGMTYYERTFRRERFLMSLLILVGVEALFLSAVGVFGVQKYVLERRLPEMGLRMALGATRARLIASVLAASIPSVALGILCGLAGGVLLMRWFESFLFGVTRFDPTTVASAIFLFLLVSTLAAFLPACRATGVDPATALRIE